MPARELTDRFCQSVKAVAGQQVAYPDAQVRGLEFRVSGNGRKVWTLRYRRASDGRQSRLTLGVYPALDLRDARKLANKELGRVGEGADPAAEKRRAKTQAKAEPIKTWADLARAYFAACESGVWKPRGKVKRATTLKDERDIDRLHITPALGSERLEDITRGRIKGLLRDMAATGLGVRVNRTHALIRQAFAYALDLERVGSNPAIGFAPVVAEQAKTRVLRDDDLKRLWVALADPSKIKGKPTDEHPEGEPIHVGRPAAIVLQLCALLLQRRSEVAGMHEDELTLDEGVWIIPAERAKNGKSHLVPLPPRAVELIREAITLRAEARERRKDKSAPLPNTDFVFPGRTAGKAIRGDSITHAMGIICGALGIKASPHDMRRTGASALASERLGVNPFIVSLVLSHRSDTGGAAAVTMRHYALYDYAAEKRAALGSWEGLLREIVGEKARPDNVRSLRRAEA